jgi:8-oxo-dGTP pyrophosphatase MutT (NUDIX family)
MEPDYACALLTDPRGWWLLQLRPSDARIAPSALTCFGGRREPGEDALACLVRELREEIGWSPRACDPRVELWRGATCIARFYAAPLDAPLESLRPEHGSVPILAPTAALPALPVSRWHALVLSAAIAGRARVELEDGAGNGG